MADAKGVGAIVGANFTADAFLWERGASPEPAQAYPVLVPQIELGEVIDIIPVAECEQIVPAGMFNQWPLEVLSQMKKPFTGLVVLIDVITIHRRSPLNDGLLRSVSACVAGMLCENDFGCRTTNDEFVMICGGLQGADAQRRLNSISEQLWRQQQRGHGAFSLIFSWGGIGSVDKPFSEAMAAAIARMNRMNRNRNVVSLKSVQHRKTV